MAEDVLGNCSVAPYRLRVDTLGLTLLSTLAIVLIEVLRASFFTELFGTEGTVGIT